MPDDKEVMRIPRYEKPADVLTWLEGMRRHGLIFHPDDAPADIIGVDKKPLFTAAEVMVLDVQMPAILADYGASVYAIWMAVAAYNDEEL